MTLDVQEERFIQRSQRWTIDDHRQLTIAFLEYVCFAVSLDPSHFAVRSAESIRRSKPNGFFTSSSSDIPTTHAFLRRPRSSEFSAKEPCRDIDGTSAMSDLRFYGIALCVVKPSESSVVECRHVRCLENAAEISLIGISSDRFVDSSITWIFEISLESKQVRVTCFVILKFLSIRSFCVLAKKRLRRKLGRIEGSP